MIEDNNLWSTLLISFDQWSPLEVIKWQHMNSESKSLLSVVKEHRVGTSVTSTIMRSRVCLLANYKLDGLGHWAIKQAKVNENVFYVVFFCNNLY